MTGVRIDAFSSPDIFEFGRTGRIGCNITFDSKTKSAFLYILDKENGKQIELGNSYDGANTLITSQYLPINRADVSVNLEQITVALSDLHYDDDYEFMCEAVGVNGVNVDRKKSKPLTIKNVQGIILIIKNVHGHSYIYQSTFI